jgi:uncharacterized protein
MASAAMPPKFSILSIDGGGLKGLIAIKLLREVELILGKPVISFFDLLAGTSTGGLIAAALAVKDAENRPLYDLEHVENIYTEVGMQVFMQGGLSLTGTEVKKLSRILKDTFGQAMLSDTLKPVFIPTYDVDAGKIIVFKTRSALKNEAKDVELVDVCRATSAIPPVFPAHLIKYDGRRVRCEDAGYHLKNPAISALAEVIKHKEYYAGAGLLEEDIALLSVSTGSQRGGGADWSTDIREVTSRQGSDMRYVRSQQLHIEFEKVRYLRIDLDLGHGAFSLNRLIEWMSRIRKIGADPEFLRNVNTILLD